MIWADRVALVWGSLLIAIMALAWKGPGYLLDDAGVWYILELAVGIPWLILRGLDIIFTGRLRFGAIGRAIGKATRPRPDITVMPPFRDRP
jgi:hypothetical protein